MSDVTGQKNSFTVEFPLSKIQSRLRIKNIEVIQKQNSHDICVISIRGRIPGADKLLGTGAPVIVRWASKSGKNTFHGYVYYVRPDNETASTSTRVVCVGTSYPLMNRAQNVWTDVTASEVVRQIARLHGMNANVDEHKRVYPQVTQSGESYWQVLLKLASETGYVLRVENSTIIFKKRESVHKFYRPIAPLLRYVDNKGPNMRVRGNLYQFSPQVGEFTPDSGAARAIRSIQGVDGTTGKVIGLKGPQTTRKFRSDRTPVFNSPEVSRVIKNLTDVSTLLDAHEEKNRFAYRAGAVALGNAYYAPERVVSVRGIEEPYSGYWTILEVRHRIKDARHYTVDMVLGTDGLGPEVGISGEADLRVATDPRLLVLDEEAAAEFNYPFPEPVLETAPVDVSGLPGTLSASTAYQTDYATAVSYAATVTQVATNSAQSLAVRSTYAVPLTIADAVAGSTGSQSARSLVPESSALEATTVLFTGYSWQCPVRFHRGGI